MRAYVCVRFIIIRNNGQPGKRSVTCKFQKIVCTYSTILLIALRLPHSICLSHVTSSARVSCIWYGLNHASNVEVHSRSCTKTQWFHEHFKVLKSDEGEMSRILYTSTDL